jgi:hypothetical protein
MIDRRRSAPLQLENAEKLESGQVGEGQVGAGQVRAGQVRAGQVRSGQVRASQVRASQVRASQWCTDHCRDSLRDVTSSQVAHV